MTSSDSDQTAPASEDLTDTPWKDPTANPFIEIRSVSKKFGDFTAVDEVSQNIYKGELFKRINKRFNDDARYVCPQAYQHVATSRLEQRLAAMASFLKLMAIGGFTYLLVGLAIWSYLSVDWSI